MGSIPEIYDTYLVPLIFESFADRLAATVSGGSPSSVLETAAGSGVVTRALAPRLPADAAYVVTDLNQPMLDRARGKQGEDARIVWKQADALALPFESGTFDAVVCQFGVMFFPDVLAGYAEARRVLAHDGRFCFNVWDAIEVNEFADVVTQAAAQVFPDDPPRFLARTPHGYHDLDLIRSQLSSAGFSHISIEQVSDTSAAPSPGHPAIAYAQGTPLRNEIEERDPAMLEVVTERATEMIAERFGSGHVVGTIQGYSIVAEV